MQSQPPFEVPSTTDTDAILVALIAHIEQLKITLYPAQEEAILEIMAGKHVILNTPTGSGKSLVATAMHFKGLCEGKRSFYTCPIKALVSEKFFALCQMFGASNVGMITGDAAINRQASIICCTAEILANIALSNDKSAHPDYVIMDEFHYYADKERGVAWQLPLLALQKSCFLLMSATLGDCSVIQTSLANITQRDVVIVQSMQRPVPLDYTFRETPLHETLQDLLSAKKTPIYLVHFSQRECVEAAQNILSIDFCSKEEKQRIIQTCHGFRFDTPFGKDMRRFVYHGIGLHHAGLLPKYRLLVEKLAQLGYLKLIIGTDTLGVGINVPIRTVLFTKLCKYDGNKTTILSVRDFKQIAGRAGRKGFDEAGSVIAQAPEHVIENKRMESRVDGNPAKKKKLVKKKPPEKNYVPWDQTTFEKLIQNPPESMQSSFQITYGILLQVLRDGGTYRHLMALIAACHDSPALKSRHRKTAAQLFRSLRHANILQIVDHAMIINSDLHDNFSMHHALTLYFLDTLDKINITQATASLDILSLLEAILDNPYVILNKQTDQLRTIRMAELKTEGMEFDDRLEELSKIEHPKPNSDFIYATFNDYIKAHPWLHEENIRPKSIVRDMYERFASFHDYVRELALQRSEGILLRYISEAYKALVQIVPDSYKNNDQFETLQDITTYLHGMLARVDNSLLTAWDDMRSSDTSSDIPTTSQQPLKFRDYPKREFKAFIRRIRHDMHVFIQALAKRDYEQAEACLRPSLSAQALSDAMSDYWIEYPTLHCDTKSRMPHFTRIEETTPGIYTVQQTLCDPNDDYDWMLEAQVDTTCIQSIDEAWLEMLRIVH